jgi:hypothetical protein
MRTKRAIAALATLLMLMVARGAPAQERGVHLDPGSPAGKEYALPVERARRETSGLSDAALVAAGPKAVPLFGRGITPPAPRRASRPRSPRRPPSRPKTAIASPQVAAALRAGGSSAEWTVGIVAAVLLSGGLLALGLRATARDRRR